MINPTAFIICFVSVTHFLPVTGTISIAECDNGRLVLQEGHSSTSSISCNGFSAGDEVTWKITSDTPKTKIECKPQCGQSSNSNLNATRTSETQSVLSIMGIPREWENASVTCKAKGKTSQIDIDVIAPAELTRCRVDYSMDPNRLPTWNVTGSCSYGNAYSSTNNYTCTWRQRKLGGSSASSDDVIITGSITKTQVTENSSGRLYYNGTCSFTSPMPAKGRFSYSVDFFPGPGTKEVGDLTIEPPGPPVLNASTCPVYFYEGIPVRCYCLQNSSAPGRPPPVLQWLDTAAKNKKSVQLSLHNLNRRSGRNFTCRLSWGFPPDHVKEEIQYEMKIAYGPDTVNVTGPEPAHEAGTDMTLTCTAHGVYPSADMTWSGVNCSSADQSSYNTRCRFVPKAEDDGKLVTCTAWNPVSPPRSRKNGTYTLSLIYPPAFPPVLTGYAPNTILSAGDNVALTCYVTGGKPLVTSVNVSCGPNVRVQPISGQTTVEANQIVWASFTVLSVDASDHGTPCVCTGHWPGRAEAYTSSATVVLSLTGGTYPAEEEQSSSAVAYIAGGVTAAVVVVIAILIVVGIVLVRRYRARITYDRPRRRHRRQERRQEEEEEHPYTGLDVYEPVGQPANNSQPADDTQETEYENAALEGVPHAHVTRPVNTRSVPETDVIGCIDGTHVRIQAPTDGFEAMSTECVKM